MSNIFFNDTATTEIYTLSLHDALPIYSAAYSVRPGPNARATTGPSTSDISWSTSSTVADEQLPCSASTCREAATCGSARRSEEHTSELQSRQYLVCRLLLEKKILILPL